MANRRRGSVKPAKTVPDIDAKTGKQRVDDSGQPKVKPAPGTSWFFVLDVSEGAQRRQIRRRGFKTKGEAQEALTTELDRLQRRERVELRRQTYGDWLVNEWLPTIQGEDIAITTWQRYAIDVRVHVLPHPIAHVQLQDLDGYHLDEHWALLRKKPATNKKGALLKPRSVHLVSTMISRSLRDAERWGHRYGNPTRRSKMPKEGYRPPHKTWSAETLKAFLHWDRVFVPGSRSGRTATASKKEPQWRGDRLYPLWHLASTTAMRRGELVALAWDDMHLDGDCNCAGRDRSVPHLVIGWAIRELAGEDLKDNPNIDPRSLERGWMWAPPKTDAGFRTISLDELDSYDLDATVTVLREWKARQRAERLALGAGWKGQLGPYGDWDTPRDLVFCQPDGTVITPPSVSEIFAARAARFGEPLSIHGLRHTWATLALEAGIPIKVVQHRLGHTRSSTTSDLYTHVKPHVDADAAQTVVDFIAGTAAKPAKRTPPRRKAAGGDVAPLPRRRPRRNDR